MGATPGLNFERIRHVPSVPICLPEEIQELDKSLLT